MVKLRTAIWFVVIGGAAIVLPFFVAFDFTATDIRIVAFSFLSLLIAAVGWMRVKIDQLQKAEVEDEEDADVLYYAVTGLSREVWGLIGFYVFVVAAVLLAVFLKDSIVATVIRWTAYVFFVFALMTAPALFNIDRGVTKEIHRRRREHLARQRRKAQLAKIKRNEPMSDDLSERLRGYNEVITLNGNHA